MSTAKTINGTTYQIPATGESGWGSEVSNFLIAVADAGLFTGGGTRSLTAELDLGTSFGIKVEYLLTQSASAADAGVVRLSNNEGVQWRNNADAANIALLVNASDRLEVDGVAIPTISSTDTFTNKTFDVDGTGNSLTNIADANIKAGAAIDASKIGGGGVSTAEFDYLGGVTSDIQTQLDAKAPVSTTVTLAGTQSITGQKTLASPILNTAVSGTAVLDEDNMSSNSATQIATQQSIKAYVDAQIATVSSSGAEYSAKSADYTVLDADNIRTVGMTTGATDKTITLPTASANTHRIITVKKVDSGAGAMILDGEGAETIDGSATLTIYGENGEVTVQCDGSNWKVITPIHEEGTWTPTAGGTSNTIFTGTPTFDTGVYTRIGNMVHVELSAVTGLSVASSGDARFHIEGSALPGFANAIRAYGTCTVEVVTDNRAVVAQVTIVTDSSTELYVRYVSTTVSSTTVSLSGFRFSYSLA